MTAKTVYLTGFMGAGKSTVGKLLATRLKRQHIDTDELIVAQTGLSIPDIFARYGEDGFRALEGRVLRDLSLQHGLVVSLGGGGVLLAHNRVILKSGTWIFLDAPFSVLCSRILSAKGRPLTVRGKAGLRILLQRRLPLYLQARHIVRCGMETPDSICQRILKLI